LSRIFDATGMLCEEAIMHVQFAPRVVAAVAAAAVVTWGTLSSAQPPLEKPPSPIEFPAPASILDPNTTPIDLASALQLAGVQNPELFLARERVTEAVALRQYAAAQLLPTLNAGLNINEHTGPLQAATGNIVKVNRGALYVGLGSAAVGAGTVNIPGLVWSGNVSDTYFGILASRQLVRRRQFENAAARNDILLYVAVAFVELLRAEGHLAVARRTRDEAHEVARVTAAFAKVGQGRQADADRATTELEERNTDILRAEAEWLTASARLCQLLNLDPSTRLVAADGCVVPAPVVPDPIPLCELLAIAMTQRPELAARRATIQQALIELQAAKLLPFSPNLIVGYSAGTFGGGSNLAAAGIVQPDGTILRQSRFDDFAGRQDFDAVVYWSLRNLGIGNVALTRLADSRLRTSQYQETIVLDQVRAEVATAYARTHARFAQIETAERALKSSTQAFQEDLIRTRNREGLPIEVLNSLRLLGRSRLSLVDAICDYNRAQFELYVALGQPPADTLARPVPPDLLTSETSK
jgi:outer membrane protein TolC